MFYFPFLLFIRHGPNILMVEKVNFQTPCIRPQPLLLPHPRQLRVFLTHPEGDRGPAQLAALALVVAAWVPGRLRRLGSQPQRSESELKAGQQPRESALSAGDALGELRLAEPVGLLDIRIEGHDQPLADAALLKKNRTIGARLLAEFAL